MEILNSINNLESRAVIVQSINQGVQIRHTIEQGKEDIKEIAQSLKDDYGIPVSEVCKVIETIFKNNLNDQKRKLDDLTEVVDIVASN